MRTLVLGATGSLGSALCMRLAADGHLVAAVGRTEETLTALTAGLAGSGHSIHVCDVSDDAALLGLFEELKSSEPLTGMVIMTGRHWLRPVNQLRPDHVREMAGDHLVVFFEATRLFLSLPRSGDNFRSIVWVASAAALHGNPGESAYAAVKAGGIAAVRSLSAEAARKKTRINAVAPGVVVSGQADAFMSKLSEAQRTGVEASHVLGLGQPIDVAGPIAFLLSEDARWMTGTCLVVDGGLTA